MKHKVLALMVMGMMVCSMAACGGGSDAVEQEITGTTAEEADENVGTADSEETADNKVTADSGETVTDVGAASRETAVTGEEAEEPESTKLYTRNVSYDADGNVCFQELYAYDGEGNLIEYMYYDSEDTLSLWFGYEYNEKGVRVRNTKYYVDGSVNYEFAYDESGNEISYVWYDPDGSMMAASSTDNAYDADGKLLGYTRYDKDGNLQEYVEYVYDEAEHRTVITTYAADGSVLSVYEKEEEYAEA